MGFEVRAGRREDLYEEAARALFELIVDDLGAVRARERVAVEVDGAADPADLLVRFLSELLFLHDARGWLFRGAEVVFVDDGRIRAEGRGERFDPDRHRIARQVKAVTYHGAHVGRDESGWSARIVLDL
jgi:SHS2 domain-containing protein